ncbi:MAG: DUF2752 domain-containing protein [Lachnospiraceae bacterium]|nr:DUF2752 domain-containing protein [Lachnospiraceae bacterium]
MNYIRTVWNRIWTDLRNNYIALLVVLAYMGITQFLFHTVCPVAIMTGHPCPGCGLTRASILLFTGHPVEAFTMNPSVFAWWFLILYLIICRYFLGKKARGMTVFLTLTCLLTLCIFVWRMWHGDMVSVPTQGLLPFLPGLFF